MVKRRIYFFDVRLFRREGDHLVEVDDPWEVFRYIGNLPPTYDHEPNRYLEITGGNDLLMQIDMVADRVRGQFAVKRRSNLPPVEARGNYRPLSLEAEEGLAEIFHFVYYPDTKIFGMEYNHFAPKIGRIHDYLKEKASHLVHHVEFEPKLAQDVRETLQRVGRITLMHIGVFRDQVDVLQEWDGDLFRGFAALRELDESARELEVVLKLGTKRRDEELSRRLLRRLPQFLENFVNRQSLSRLEVRAYDVRANRTIPIDLLEDKLVAVREVVALDEEYKAIDSESMYQAIEDAYADLRDSLIHT